jgi:hypothetical protein
MLNALARLSAIFNEIATDAELCPEVDLVSRDGLLAGRADLVVRSRSETVVIDYKTGAVMDPGTGAVRDGYARQLKLYAYLEHEVTDLWPSRAVLVPFEGSTVNVEIDPQDCEALAADARTALAAYNALVPEPPPARPAPATCIWCHAAAACAEFWAACDLSWRDDGVVAGRGVVDLAKLTPLGGLTLRFESLQGSLQGSTRVRAIDPGGVEAPVPAPQDIVALVGLREDHASHSFLPGSNLRLRVEHP